MKPKILYFGCYRPLAATRCILLEQAGFDVSYSTDPHQAARMIAERTPEEKPVLTVVCNSCDDQVYGDLTLAFIGNSISVPVIRLDESYPAAWRDPELLASLLRATIRGGVPATEKKPPQAAQSAQSVCKRDAHSRLR